MAFLKNLTGLLILLITFNQAQAQQDYYEEMLEEEVEVENPVYMPVLGIGGGVSNFHGELSRSSNDFLIGQKNFKINISTFIDAQHFYTGNFYFITGSFAGEDYSRQYPNNYMNFKSNFTTFGINLQYHFEHFIPPVKLIHPYVAAGFELIGFDSKTDLYNAQDEPYHYNIDRGVFTNEEEKLIQRDHSYETTMRGAEEIDLGQGKYSQNALGTLFEIGVKLTLSDRAYVEIGHAFHYTFTDLIDHVSPDNDRGIQATNTNDWFSNSYISFNIDMFSSPEAVTVKKLAAEVDFDKTMYNDQDKDRVLDRADQCPRTPPKAEVDSVGCPVDSDNDGIPDFRDKENDTPKGAFVNERGEELTEEKVAELISGKNAMKRKNVDQLMENNLNISTFNYKSIENIPEKYQQVDKNRDGYISYEEVLQTIDAFFNGTSEFNTSDIYKLKEIFFKH